MHVVSDRKRVNLILPGVGGWGAEGLGWGVLGGGRDLLGWLLNVSATCKCISGTDLLRQLHDAATLRQKL